MLIEKYATLIRETEIELDRQLGTGECCDLLLDNFPEIIDFKTALDIVLQIPARHPATE